MAGKSPYNQLENLPACAQEFIKLVIRKMRYRKNVRHDVAAELAAHFEDELKSCATADGKEQKAQKLIEDFGDAKLLGILLRRAKKRCRPLWQTVFARTFQTIGILILCLIVYLVWFLTGKPVITTNYVAELNRIVRPVADESLNAAPLYRQAAERYSKLPDNISKVIGKKYHDANDAEKQLMQKWLTDNKETLDLVIAGTKKPYYWQKYEGEEMTAILTPHLTEFFWFVYSLCWRAHFHTEQGQYKDAFDDIEHCYRLGQHLRGDKILSDQLVGIAIEALALHIIRNIISKYDIDSDSLAALQHHLEQMISNENFTVNLKEGRLFMYDEIQRCFTEDRLGKGHISLEGLRRYQTLAGKGTTDFAVLERFLTAPIHILFTHPNKQQSKEMADRFYDYWEKIFSKSPCQIKAEGIDIEKESMEIIKGNILLEILLPAFATVNEISHRLMANVRATLTIIAALRYRQDKGQSPETLQELVATGYLNELPIDPFSDKPLVYRKTDDSFTIYSVGTNFTDDNGEVAKDDKGRPRKYADQGDWVFWPVNE